MTPTPASLPARGLIWGLGFSHGSAPMLERLSQAGLIDARLGPTDQPLPREGLVTHWPSAHAFVVVGACGLVTRLIAPCSAARTAIQPWW